MLDFNPRMKIQLILRSCISLLLPLLLISCSMPASDGGFSQTRQVAYTAAAETVIAQLTAVALTATPAVTPIPTEAQVPTSIDLASETPLPSATFTPTASPTSEVISMPTAVPDDPKLQLGEPDWQDKFKNGDNWSLYEDEYVRFRVPDEVLIMTAFDAIGRDSWMLTWPEPENYYLEVVAIPETCEGLDRYGIIFRTDADVGYLYGFSCDGQYSLRRWNGDTFKMLVEWTSSPYILPGADQMNSMGLMVDDDEFSLYANGYLLEEVSDDSYPDGGIGLFVASDETDEFKVQVSEVTYWELP